MSNERWELNIEQIAELHRAARKIEDVVRSLDPAMTGPCPHCGRDSAKNYAEFRLSQELGGMARKLDKIVYAARQAERRKQGEQPC